MISLQIEDADNCVVCREATGFSTLCNTGNHGDHRVCLDCVVGLYQYRQDNFLLCPLCRGKFNFQDHLVVRELHLIQSQPEESILAYHAIMGNNPLQGSLVAKFLLLDEEDQIEMISKMYWGNDRLFDGVYDLLFGEDDDYSTNIAQNKRIKENLLEVFGDFWSSRVEKAEKITKLSQIFRNGWLVKSCKNESQETFLHRCHLFLRANLPLHQNFNKYILSRMRNVQKFFPEYGVLLNDFNLLGNEIDQLHVVERPATGPLDVEKKLELYDQPLFFTVNWALFHQVQILKNKDLEDNLTEACLICHKSQGFPILCEGEHKFCLDCVVYLYQLSRKWVCVFCNTPFNFHDYLVVRELHLIHSRSEQFVLNYFHAMMYLRSIPHSNKLCFRDFLWLDEFSQKKMISKIYWGNDELFDLVAYGRPNSARNRRIRENLLEIFGDLWSPALGKKEKDRKLLEVFTNGWLIKSCQNELQETFLHRCHLFLRTFLPPNTDFNANIAERMQMVVKVFPEYYRLQYRTMKHRPYIKRPATGPLDVENIGFVRNRDCNWDVGLLQRGSKLKDEWRSSIWYAVGASYFPTRIAILGMGDQTMMTVALLQLTIFSILLVCGFLYCKYFTYRVQQKIHTDEIQMDTVAITAGVTTGLIFYLMDNV